MMVVAIAHQDELRARRAMERSLARLSTMAQQHVGVKRVNDARWECAIVAFREARFALAAAERRHSMWYRAYLRARAVRR